MTEEMVAKKARPDLVTIIAAYRFVVAALMLLIVALLGIGLLAVVLNTAGDELVIASIAIGVAILVVLAILVANVAAGWGLLALKDWARWLVIVMAVLSLANVPIGTVTGALQLWYLFTPEAKEAFEVAAQG